MFRKSDSTETYKIMSGQKLLSLDFIQQTKSFHIQRAMLNASYIFLKVIT